MSPKPSTSVLPPPPSSGATDPYPNQTGAFVEAFDKLQNRTDCPEMDAEYRAAVAMAAALKPQMDNFLAGVGLAMNEPTNFLHDYYNGGEERKWLEKKNYTKPVTNYELRAVKRAMCIEALGYNVNHETIDAELKITRLSPRYEPANEAETMAAELAREAETFPHEIDMEPLGELGTHTIISGGEVLELGRTTNIDEEMPI